MHYHENNIISPQVCGDKGEQKMFLDDDDDMQTDGGTAEPKDDTKDEDEDEKM